jgi:hypothetical protein
MKAASVYEYDAVNNGLGKESAKRFLGNVEEGG